MDIHDVDGRVYYCRIKLEVSIINALCYTI